MLNATNNRRMWALPDGPLRFERPLRSPKDIKAVPRVNEFLSQTS